MTAQMDHLPGTPDESQVERQNGCELSRPIPKFVPLLGTFVAGMMVGGLIVGAVVGLVSKAEGEAATTTFAEEQGSNADEAKRIEAAPGQPITAPTMKIIVEGVSYTEDLMLSLPDEHKYPRDGAVFALVKTKVENLSPDQGWDLTCGYTGAIIPAAAFTDKGNKYLPTCDLFRVQGNPECNENTPAGFEVDMTWIFEIPQGDVINQVAFNDPKDAETKNPVAYYADLAQ